MQSREMMFSVACNFYHFELSSLFAVSLQRVDYNKHIWGSETIIATSVLRRLNYTFLEYYVPNNNRNFEAIINQKSVVILRDL